MLKAKVLKEVPKFQSSYKNANFLKIRNALEKLNLKYKSVKEIDIYNILQLIKFRGK